MESFSPGFMASDWGRGEELACFPLQGIGQSIFDLYCRLREYYRRDLSFGMDSILAFDGVVNEFDELEYFLFRVKQFYGVLALYCDDDQDLARKSFISSLCW